MTQIATGKTWCTRSLNRASGWQPRAHLESKKLEGVSFEISCAAQASSNTRFYSQIFEEYEKRSSAYRMELWVIGNKVKIAT